MLSTRQENFLRTYGVKIHVTKTKEGKIPEWEVKIERVLPDGTTIQKYFIMYGSNLDSSDVLNILSNSIYFAEFYQCTDLMNEFAASFEEAQAISNRLGIRYSVLLDLFPDCWKILRDLTN